MFGRGGLPYRFSGIGGGPRFLSFLDDSTLLAASGQPGGGMQILPIFMEDPQQHSLYIQPQYLYNNEEQITALHVDTQNIITVGTSHSQIIQFATNDPYMHPDMESPAYPPAPSGIDLDPYTLSQSYSLKSGNIFGQCVIFSDNTSLSSAENFGTLEQQCIIPAPKRRLQHAIHEVVQARSDDFLSTLPTRSLGLHDMLLQHNINYKHHSADHVSEARCTADTKVKRYNPNQLLFNEAAYRLAYDDTFAVNRKANEQLKRNESVRDTGQEDPHAIPYRYRRVIRPAGSLSFDYSKFNETLLFPGWDCHERNVYVAPVLTLLYFIPEYRKALQSVDIQRRILEDAIASARKKPLSIFYETGELIAELSFLFHQIDMLSTHALVSQIPSTGVFSPKNFLATFTQMPEAAALNLFDTTSSEAVAVLDLNKRAEAFYRFLIHHLDSTLGYASSVDEDSQVVGLEQQNSLKESSRPRLVESVQGMKVLTINYFPTTSTPTATETRALVLPLSCDNCSPNLQQAMSFGEILLSSLYVESSIKAYCKISKSYENVKQQRSVCSLPRVLSLSASGVKKSDGAAQCWQNSNRHGGKWLPSQLELGELTLSNN
jgi:hypothetical protein